jgi:hypothetical protein
MGHHHYGGWGGGWGGNLGFGWFFPALIVGKMIGDAVQHSQGQPWPPVVHQPWPQTPPAPQTPTAPQPQATPAQSKVNAVCANCGEAVNSEFGYCPRCGKRLGPAPCRYCGQTLDPKLTHCAHCGAPALQRR